MPEMVMDWTMWNYLLTLIVSIYGAGLFGWWAHKAGSPSAVFLYVMGIFIAVGWSMGVAMYGRYVEFYLLHPHEANIFIRESPFWVFRTLPITIVLIALCIHMTARVFRKNNSLRREGD